jgi:UDP:flavonoid glycosyltransferase YjiC (YdhE family)
MTEQIRNNDLPLVGFFPLFYNLAETGRAVLVAKRYIEKGGKAIFFSHGGKYEYLARDIGCKVISVNPIYTEDFVSELWKYSRLEKFGPPFKKQVLKEHVDAEVAAYEDTDVAYVVSTNNFPCCLSTRVAKIPYIAITPRFSVDFKHYPEDAEFFFTGIIPEWIKVRVLNWRFRRSMAWSRPFNALAREYGVARFTYPQQITHGDYTLFSDFLELSNVNFLDKRANEFYIGPIFFDELFDDISKNQDKITNEIRNHIKKGEKSILVSLGSSGTKELFESIIRVLGCSEYRVVAVYTSVLSSDALPMCNENILLEKYVPSMREVNKMVDLAILHGGQGTVYTAAYSSKPVVGFPMQFEQHMNLEMLERKGVARIASRRRFSEEGFLSLINEMFSNYSDYLNNAKELAKSLPAPQGDVNACKILMEIIHENAIK